MLRKKLAHALIDAFDATLRCVRLIDANSRLTPCRPTKKEKFYADNSASMTLYINVGIAGIYKGIRFEFYVPQYRMYVVYEYRTREGEYFSMTSGDVIEIEFEVIIH